MSVLDPVASLFTARSRQLYWARMPDDHVGRGYKAAPIQPGEAYFVLRLREMSLGYARKLWRKYYPMLHGFVRHGGREEQQLLGPGQLKEISDSNLERIINLNQRIVGPIPYDGGDVELVAGLYSVPAGDAAKALIQTVGDLAGMAGLAAGQLPQLVTALKAGVESIFRLNGSQLQLGLRDTHVGGGPLKPGVYVGIAAPREEVLGLELWLDQGRLIKGVDPIAGDPYTDHDYMVLELERRDTREDWGTLPGIAGFEKRFADVMRASTSPAEKRKKLGELWPEFDQSLRDSRDLTRVDKQRILGAVGADLKARLAQLERGNPFETRSMGGERNEVKSDDFNLLDVDMTSGVLLDLQTKPPFTQDT